MRVVDLVPSLRDELAVWLDRSPFKKPTDLVTLRVYAAAVKRRQRLAGAELEQFSRAIEWAQWARMGTNGADELPRPLAAPVFAQTKTPR